MKNKKIVSFGNSVGIRVRPNKGKCKSYSDLLNDNEELSFENFCYSGNMIGSISRNPDFILQKHADVVILQFGVVELSSRSTSKNLYDYLNYKAKSTRLGQFIQTVGLSLESKLRRALVYLRFKSSWYHSDRFLSELETTIKSLDSNSLSKIICIGISTPSERIEKNLPGTIRRIKNVQFKMRAICSKYQSCNYLDVEHFETNYLPDGIHFSAEGHRKVYNDLLCLINN